MSPQTCTLMMVAKDKLYTWTGDSLRFSELWYWQKFQKMILILFVNLWKKITSPKFEDCSPKIRPAMAISSLNFSRAWQLHFLCHTLVLLKNHVLFIDEEMILKPFFHNSTQILVNWKKLIFYLKFRPHFEQID